MSSPVIGQTCGWAVNEPFSFPSKFSADRGEIAVERVREVALLEGEQSAGVPEHVGVGLRCGHFLEAGVDVEHLLVGRGDERRRHVPVAIPLGAAVAKANAVDHAVAEEGVVGVSGQGVGAVADVAAVEFWWDRADHLQVAERALLAEWRPVPSQEKRKVFSG